MDIAGVKAKKACGKIESKEKKQRRFVPTRT